MMRQSHTYTCLAPLATGSAITGAIAKATGQPLTPTSQPDYPRTLRLILSAGWVSTTQILVLVTGTDRAGLFKQEYFVILANSAAATTFFTTSIFASVQQITSWDTPAGWTAGTFTIGLGNTFGIPCPATGAFSACVALAETSVVGGAASSVAPGSLTTAGAFVPTTTINGSNSFALHYTTTV